MAPMAVLVRGLALACLGAAIGIGGAGPSPGGSQAEHPGHLGRRHRLVQHQRLQSGGDGLQDAQHRPDRPRRRPVHRLVRAAELHRRARRLHHGAVAGPHRPDQGRPARGARGPEQVGPDHRRAVKPLGYATGQFGKNHLGDRNEHLPTVHGFDEFFGNLYHLNAEEEPENIDYPKNPEFKGSFGPRGVLHCYATALEEAGEDPRFGAWGKQRCEDTGPLTARADGDGRPGVPDRRGRLHRQGAPGQPAVLRLVQLDPDAHLDPSGARRRGQDRDRRLPRRHGRA